ncbi:hypothetical protein [Enterococcus casseliflavus]|uniref:hypothetical protein n=1 Tax=Enterococcus casseliflavus TaxID=37734 RepID=UPI00188393C9|nr:hypothetical protein [Enterococcus casseliflavus]MBE9909340.1 hypothetical protein [Enterococcus casseliflavus]
MKRLIWGLLFSAFALTGCVGQEGNGSQTKETGSSYSNDITSWSSGESYSSPYIYSEKNEITTEQKNIIPQQIYGLNEEAVLIDPNVQNLYSLKVIQASTRITPDSVATQDEHANLVELTYEYKNYNYEKSMLVSSQYITAYDSDGLAGTDLGYMNGQTEVSSGGNSARAKMWFEMSKDPTSMTEIEIDYANDFSLGFEGTMTFKVPLEH